MGEEAHFVDPETRIGWQVVPVVATQLAVPTFPTWIEECWIVGMVESLGVECLILVEQCWIVGMVGKSEQFELEFLVVEVDRKVVVGCWKVVERVVEIEVVLHRLEPRKSGREHPREFESMLRQFLFSYGIRILFVDVDGGTKKPKNLLVLG